MTDKSSHEVVCVNNMAVHRANSLLHTKEGNKVEHWVRHHGYHLWLIMKTLCKQCFSANGFIIINYGCSSGGVVEAYLITWGNCYSRHSILQNIWKETHTKPHIRK